MKSIQRKITALFLAITFLFAQFSLSTYEVSAASVTADTSWKKLYKNHLYSNRPTTVLDLNGYYVLDIDKNGMPELITATCKQGITTYDVYTVKKGKMIHTGSAKSTGSYIPLPIIRYSSKCKALHIYRGYKGYGTSGESLYRIVNGKLTEQFRADVSYIFKHYYKGNNSSNLKEVSKSTYNAYMKNYIKTYKAYKMLPNTYENRRKSFG